MTLDPLMQLARLIRNDQKQYEAVSSGLSCVNVKPAVHKCRTWLPRDDCGPGGGNLAAAVMSGICRATVMGCKWNVIR